MDNNLENKDHSYSVPEGYFEQLPVQIRNGIFLEKLKAKVADTGFNTPIGYFDELTKQINTEIIADRLKTITPISESASVPVNYFEQLQANILSKTVDQTKKKQPTIIRLLHSSILKYASAACFIILSATGLYFYQLPHHPVKPVYSDLATEQMLYNIDEQVIIDHIEANDLHQAKASPSDVALENYILNNYTQSDIASVL